MRKAVILLFFLLTLACRAGAWWPGGAASEMPIATRPAAKVVIRRAVTPTPYDSLTLQEPWALAEPELKAWAADAVVGVRWECRGVLTPDGRCSSWGGHIVSARRQESGGVDVLGRRVKVQGAGDTIVVLVNAILNDPIPVGDLPDSPAVVEVGRAWLAAQGLPEAQVTGFVVSTGRRVDSCGVETAEPVFVLRVKGPEGLICLDRAGQVITGDIWGR